MPTTSLDLANAELAEKLNEVGRCAADASPLSHPFGAEPASAVSGKAGIANAEDFNAVWDNRPAAPARDKPIEVTVVGRRCVYVNNYRVAGGKPYYSENLPQHDFKTTLGEVLDAFSEADIRAALKEKKARADYFKAYHARKAEQAAKALWESN